MTYISQSLAQKNTDSFRNNNGSVRGVKVSSPRQKDQVEERSQGVHKLISIKVKYILSRVEEKLKSCGGDYFSFSIFC